MIVIAPLGVWIAENGNQKKQLLILQEKVNNWLAAIGKSLLRNNEKILAYSMFLRPQIAYPVGCMTIAVKDLRCLFFPVLNIILHTLV